MNRGLLIQIAVLTPLGAAAAIFFGIGWWIPGVIAALGAVAAFLWMRRTVTKPYADAALAAAKEDLSRENDSR